MPIGAEIAADDASERIIVGGSEQVTLCGMNDRPDYLTCGHIHKRQHIRDTDWARYSGSVLPMSFAEKSYTHGVDLVDIYRTDCATSSNYATRHSIRSP